jgi:hypothetical protein
MKIIIASLISVVLMLGIVAAVQTTSKGNFIVGEKSFTQVFKEQGGKQAGLTMFKSTLSCDKLKLGKKWDTRIVIDVRNYGIKKQCGIIYIK